MREKVKGLHFGDLITTFDEIFEISRLSGWIAGNIHEALWTILKQLLAKTLVATFPWGINDHSGSL